MESDDALLQRMLDKLNASADSNEFTVAAPEGQKEALIRFRNMLDGPDEGWGVVSSALTVEVSSEDEEDNDE